MSSPLHRDTLALRVAVERSLHGEHSEALYLSSGFVQPNAAAAARRFAGDEDGYTYGRSGNPTVSSFEQRLAALEGSEAALATASGMAAITLVCFGLLKAGDHVLYSQSMFGSTLKLVGTEFARFGVESTSVPQTDLGAWARAVRPNTRLLLAETPTNPLTEVCDIAALADLAHAAGAWLAVDNCFATPALQRPLEFGADIVLHSGTKFLDGQGRVMAGAVCASADLIHQRLLPVQKNTGMVLSPFNAWVVLKGLETLSLRLQAQSAQALALAQWLQAHPAVAWVHYPGLASHPQHALAKSQMDGPGGIIAFELNGGLEAGRRLINSVRLCQVAVSLGDADTLIQHPASMTHAVVPPEARLKAGISDGLVRISVGLEDYRDIIADLEQALQA